MQKKSTKSKSTKVPKPLTENDLMKLEIADELGYIDKINATGWKSLTSRESGKIGGIMAKRNKDKRNQELIINN